MSEIKYHPILFKGEMVRAILDKRKSQTRRVITKLNSTCGSGYPFGELDFDNAWIDPGLGNGQYLHAPFQDVVERVRCKWNIGDRLWLRETFFYEWPTEDPPEDMRDCRIVFRADEPNYIDSTMREEDNKMYRWSPSIFMPRWVSRITLRITNIRVERVQDITWGEAIAEGITFDEKWQIPKNVFSYLWNSINKKPATTWAANPWVWVIEFEVVENDPQ